MSDLTVLALNGTLKRSGPSSTQVLLDQVLDALSGRGVTGDSVRLAEHDIHPGVEDDMGDGDAWPALRERVLAADVLLVGTPIWMGQPSSVTKRALERLNALMAATDDQGRMVTFGKVAGVVVTGNEDGAHHVTAELYQALNDCGFTIPANAGNYWVGEARGGTDYADLDETPESVAATTATMATNLAHTARLLRDHPYPPAG